MFERPSSRVSADVAGARTSAIDRHRVADAVYGLHDQDARHQPRAQHARQRAQHLDPVVPAPRVRELLSAAARLGPALPWRMHARRTAAAHAAQPELQDTLVHPDPAAGHKSHSRQRAPRAASACARLTHAWDWPQELAVRACAAACGSQHTWQSSTVRRAGSTAQCAVRQTCPQQ